VAFTSAGDYIIRPLSIDMPHAPLAPHRSMNQTNKQTGATVYSSRIRLVVSHTFKATKDEWENVDQQRF
jgi:hypothetical protein